MKYIVATVLALLCLVVPHQRDAWASNPHFIGPAPSVSCSGSSCTASGFTIAGLGNQPVTETLTVSQSFTATCVNNGGNVAPGQGAITTSGSSSQQGVSLHNGTYQFGSLSASAPQPPSSLTGTAAGCPNDNWTVSSWTPGPLTYQLTVTQGAKTVYSAP